MKPGIYTDMPEDEYHAIDALGSTAIKDLYSDPTEYQYKRMHPEEEGDSAAKLLGSAIHCRLLEGRKAFHDKYYLSVDKAAEVEAGALDTTTHMKKWLRNHGENVSGTKAELIARIREVDTEVPILEEIIADHAAANKNKSRLTRTQWDKVVSAADWCQGDKLLGDFMEDGTFNLGMSEVSIVAEHEGVLVKARYDHLPLHAIIDVKTFAPTMNREPIYAIPYTIKKLGYDLQAGHYKNMWHKAKELWDAGQVFGPYPDGYFEKVFRRQEPTWIWLFIKTIGAPQPYVRGFNPDSTAFRYAQQNAEEAILFYRQKMHRLGPDVPWPPDNKAEELGDEELLRY